MLIRVIRGWTGVNLRWQKKTFRSGLFRVNSGNLWLGRVNLRF